MARNALQIVFYLQTTEAQYDNGNSLVDRISYTMQTGFLNFSASSPW